MTVKATNAMEKMIENLALIEKSVEKFNKASSDGDVKIANECVTEMDTLMGEYTAAAKTYAFEEIIERAGGKSSEIFKEAVKALRFKTIRVVETKDNDTGIASRSISDATKPIDPLDVQKYYGSVIALEQGWQYAMERFNFAVTLRVGIDIGMPRHKLMKISDSYAMNKINNDVRKSAVDDAIADPTSNTSLAKEMQNIVNMCVGDKYKVTSHDVKFLLHCWGKKDNKKGLTITAAGHKQLRMTFMDVMNNLINFADAKDENGLKVSGYEISYKAKRDADKTPSGDFIPTGNTPKTEPKKKSTKTEPKKKSTKVEKEVKASE